VTVPTRERTLELDHGHRSVDEPHSLVIDVRATPDPAPIGPEPLNQFVESLRVAAVHPTGEKVLLSGTDITQTTYPVEVRFRRTGVLFVVMLLLVVTAVITASQTSAGPKIGPPPRLHATAKAADVAGANAAGSAAAGGASGVAVGGGGGSGGGTSSGADNSGGSGSPDAPGSPAETPPGLRQGTATDQAAVEAAVPATPGMTVEQVLFAESDPSWGVEYVDGGAGTPGAVVLVDDVAGWTAVASGPAPLGCSSGVPAAVMADLASVMSC
jgi:hypothetical protein